MNTNGNSYPSTPARKTFLLALSSGLDSCETTGKAETPQQNAQKTKNNKMAGHVLMSATLPDLSQVGEAVPPFANDLRKIGQAADSDSKVGMASMRRVTVRASRTRPGPQTRRRTPPSRASLIEMRTSVEMPELSICGMPFRDDDNFLCAAFDDRFESVVKLLGGLADGKPTVDFEHRHPSGCADVDFHGQTVSHGGTSTYPMWRQWRFTMPHGIIRWRVSWTK